MGVRESNRRAEKSFCSRSSKKSLCLNSLVLAATAVNTRLVLTVGVNVHLTFGRENLISKDKMFEA